MAQFALQKICRAHVSLGSWVAVRSPPPLISFPHPPIFPLCIKTRAFALTNLLIRSKVVP